MEGRQIMAKRQITTSEWELIEIRAIPKINRFTYNVKIKNIFTNEIKTILFDNTNYTGCDYSKVNNNITQYCKDNNIDTTKYFCNYDNEVYGVDCSEELGVIDSYIKDYYFQRVFDDESWTYTYKKVFYKSL